MYTSRNGNAGYGSDIRDLGKVRANRLDTAPGSAPSGRITPNKLLRNLSSNAIAAVSGQTGRDGGSPSLFDAQTAIDPLSQVLQDHRPAFANLGTWHKSLY